MNVMATIPAFQFFNLQTACAVIFIGPKRMILHQHYWFANGMINKEIVAFCVLRETLDKLIYFKTRKRRAKNEEYLFPGRLCRLDYIQAPNPNLAGE